MRLLTFGPAIYLLQLTFVRKDYQVVFYDWDGCIAKTLSTWIAASKKVLAEEDIHPKDQDIIQLFGDWRALQILGHSDLDKAIDHFLMYLRRDLKTVELYPEILETLKAICGKGIKVAILSTSRRESIEAARAYPAVSECVEFIIAAEDVTQHKPHPESIKQALDKLNLNPEEAVLVGDSDKDIDAAHNAGIDSVLFAPQEHTAYYDLGVLKALKPTHTIAHHRAILDYV